MRCKRIYISDQNDAEHSYSLPVARCSTQDTGKPTFNAANHRCIEHVGKCRDLDNISLECTSAAVLRGSRAQLQSCNCFILNTWHSVYYFYASRPDT